MAPLRWAVTRRVATRHAVVAPAAYPAHQAHVTHARTLRMERSPVPVTSLPMVASWAMASAC
jgi:hypothetical protein